MQATLTKPLGASGTHASTLGLIEDYLAARPLYTIADVLSDVARKANVANVANVTDQQIRDYLFA